MSPEEATDVVDSCLVVAEDVAVKSIWEGQAGARQTGVSAEHYVRRLLWGAWTFFCKLLTTSPNVPIPFVC